jgi:hypothetical protein
VSTTTIEEIEFNEKFARECAFVTTLSAFTPSNIRWGDKVEEDRLTRNSDLEGEQTQCPTTSSKWVTGPPWIASVSELPSRQRVGTTTSDHQRLMRRSNRAPRRLEPHLAIETGISCSGSTSGGSYLVRGQVDDSW